MNHFTQKKLLDFKRTLGHTGAAYACPICALPFNQEPKLWIHAKEVHPGSLEAIGILTEEEAGKREAFKQQAQVAQSLQKPASGERAEKIDTERKRSGQSSPPRPSTAPERKEQDIQTDPDPESLDTGHDKIPSMGNPKKRGAGSESASADPPGSQAASSPHTRPRHSKTHSSSQIQDIEFARRQGSAPAPPGQRRLFDHTMDNQPTGNISSRPKSPKRRGHQARTSRGRSFEPLLKGVPFDSSRKPKPQFPSNEGTTQALQPATGSIQKPHHPIVLQTRTHQHEADRRLTDEAGSAEQDDPEPDPSMLTQPETRPISHDQLVIEVKGIYAGLVMVEAKCIDVDEKRTPGSGKDPALTHPLSNDQWKSLIALHKQLLHEHHDFFLASQHPSASENLSKLAGKYSMPARMWRHGIHGFLEVLRYQLPHAFEHMLAFIYIAYSMMALLYETVPSFEDTWVECLGDLARYRMAIEEEEPRDRETWSGVARYWYSKASDKTPEIGRLYHHLAILARPYTVEQLCLYTKALTCISPFESTRGSIMTLFNPILKGAAFPYHKPSEFERLVIKVHGIFFTSDEKTTSDVKKQEDLVAVIKQVKSSIDGWVGDFPMDFRNREDLNKIRLKKILAYLATSNVAGIFEHGALTEEKKNESRKPRSIFRRAFDEMNHQKALLVWEGKMKDLTISKGSVLQKPELPEYLDAPLPVEEIKISKIMIDHASSLAFGILGYALNSKHWPPINDVSQTNVCLPLVHIMLTFIWSAAQAEEKLIACSIIGLPIPWESLCNFLNSLVERHDGSSPVVLRDEFPAPSKEDTRPLWEDYLLRGMLYTMWYFPNTWFSDPKLDDEERQLETASMEPMRMERLLWLGHRIASFGKWIMYDRNSDTFAPSPAVTQKPPVDSDQATDTQSTAGASIRDPDTIMSDAPGPGAISPERTSIAPSDAPEVSIASTAPTSATQTPEPASKQSTPQINPKTPKNAALDEHDDDIPMMDISPTKEEPPSDPSNPVGATAWVPGSVVESKITTITPNTQPSPTNDAKRYLEGNH